MSAAQYQQAVQKRDSWTTPLGFLLGVFLLLWSLQACSLEESTPGGNSLGSAPSFSLPNMQGKTVRLSDYSGKVVILDFWATWCPPCREEIPHFIGLYQKYRSQGFEIVGISMDLAGPGVVESFIREYGINYPILMGNEEVTLNYGGIRGIPTTFVIDRQGRIHKKFVGYQGKETFENLLKALL